jgi:hypothetical protein
MRDITNQPCHAVDIVESVSVDSRIKNTLEHNFHLPPYLYDLSRHALFSMSRTQVIEKKRSPKSRCHALYVTHFCRLSRTFNYVTRTFTHVTHGRKEAL